MAKCCGCGERALGSSACAQYAVAHLKTLSSSGNRDAAGLSGLVESSVLFPYHPISRGVAQGPLRSPA